MRLPAECHANVHLFVSGNGVETGSVHVQECHLGVVTVLSFEPDGIGRSRRTAGPGKRRIEIAYQHFALSGPDGISHFIRVHLSL